MGYTWKDYLVPNFSTKQNLVTHAVFVGVSTMLPTAVKCAYKNINCVATLTGIGGIATSTFLFAHHFKDQHTKLGMVVASSFYGLGCFGVYKMVYMGLDYIAKEFGWNVDENSNWVTSAVLTVGVTAIVPQPLQQLAINKIGYFASIIAEQLLLQDIESDNRYNEDLDMSDIKEEDIVGSLQTPSEIDGNFHE
ncbi:MAG: hypothetical protein HRU36_00655 [Rickettsiales bacterium]|nr:hypothetical protein [Rickettsiales bacterium]